MATKAKKKLNYEELSDTDLKNRIRDLESEIVSARQKLRVGQFKKVSEFTRLRKDIARAHTFLRARELKATHTRKAS